MVYTYRSSFEARGGSVLLCECTATYARSSFELIRQCYDRPLKNRNTLAGEGTVLINSVPGALELEGFHRGSVMGPVVYGSGA